MGGASFIRFSRWDITVVLSVVLDLSHPTVFAEVTSFVVTGKGLCLWGVYPHPIIICLIFPQSGVLAFVTLGLILGFPLATLLVSVAGMSC
jgi:hypothetical protein